MDLFTRRYATAQRARRLADALDAMATGGEARTEDHYPAVRLDVIEYNGRPVTMVVVDYGKWKYTMGSSVARSVGALLTAAAETASTPEEFHATSSRRSE